MKNRKRTLAICLAAMLTQSALPVPVLAAQESTPKEEVVYINLNADGSVKEIYVVNIFNLEEKGKIIDYGSYETVRNMTTTDAIRYQNGMVTIDADAGRLYYEGKRRETAMPWTVSIQYFMDGREYPADEIAGMSGRLEIKMAIRQNESCDRSFFDGYALQTTFALDTGKAKSITAEGATAANVGSEKQLIYTILPGREKDISILADVKDFEMGGISIQGVRMDLAIEVDDGAFLEKIEKAANAAGDLDEGAGKLSDGAAKLYDAAGKLNTATGELSAGVGSLYKGSVELKDGLAELASKNDELTGAARSVYEALCRAAQTQLNAQLLAKGLEPVTLAPDTYSDTLLHVLARMDAAAVYNKAYQAALSEVTAKVEAQAEALYMGYIQSQADALYTKAASEAVVRQLLANGNYSQDQAAAYLETDAGRQAVADAKNAMTEDQKKQIIATAASSLTEEQKAAIRAASVEQAMAGSEVTGKINEAVKAVSSAAAEVSALKGQLDSYSVFYNGLASYARAVASASNGADALANGLSTLAGHTDTLKSATGDLSAAVGAWKDGTGELKGGTAKFAEETADMGAKVSEEIDSMTASMTGRGVEPVSFVSRQNTAITSVQFVIQTERIQIAESAGEEGGEEAPLTFWQKLLRLFGPVHG